MRKEFGIFGSGPAGLASAIYLSNLKHDVSIYRPNNFVVPRSVYTTSVNCPSLDGLSESLVMSLPILRVMTANNTDLRVSFPSGFMLDNVAFVHRLESIISDRAEFVDLPQETMNRITFKEENDHAIAIIDGQTVMFDRLVDATGINASVARQVDSVREKEDFLVAYVYGTKLRGKFEQDEMILIFGPAGGTSWASPSIDPGYIDVVYSANGRYSDYQLFTQTAAKRLQILRTFLQDKPGIEITDARPEHTYSGMIRSQPTPNPRTNRTYCVGESAGMARPGSGESLNRSIKGAELLAYAMHLGLSPQQFYQVWRKLWNDDYFYAGVVTRLARQRVGKIGTTADHAQQLIRKGYNSDDMVNQYLRWVVDNRIDLSLFVQIIRNPTLFRTLLETAKNRSILALLGLGGLSHLSDEWSLPDLLE